jgi:IMP dehydrogenase
MDMIRRLKAEPLAAHVDIIGGNVATYEGRQGLVDAGADAVKVGVGPGSICTTRVVAGVGVPQVTAIYEAARAASPAGRPGDRRRRPAVLRRHRQGARGRRRHRDARLAAGRLRGEPRRAGVHQRQAVQELPRHGLAGRDATRGTQASLVLKDRYFQADVTTDDKLVPEGIEGQVAYRGPLAAVAYQLVGGLRQSMFYSGAAPSPELQERKGRSSASPPPACASPPARHPDDRRSPQLLQLSERHDRDRTRQARRQAYGFDDIAIVPTGAPAPRRT